MLGWPIFWLANHASVAKNVVNSMNLQSQMIAPVFSDVLYAVIAAHQMALHFAGADASKFVVPGACSNGQYFVLPSIVHSMNVQSQMIAPVFSDPLYAVIAAHQISLLLWPKNLVHFMNVLY